MHSGTAKLVTDTAIPILRRSVHDERACGRQGEYVGFVAPETVTDWLRGERPQGEYAALYVLQHAGLRHWFARLTLTQPS